MSGELSQVRITTADGDELLPISEAIELLDLKKRTFYRYSSIGRIATITHSGRTYVSRMAIAEYLAERVAESQKRQSVRRERVERRDARLNASKMDEQRGTHSADVCGWDFDALADITRLAGKATTAFECCALGEALIEWFHEQGLNLKKLGGHRE